MPPRSRKRRACAAAGPKNDGSRPGRKSAEKASAGAKADAQEDYSLKQVWEQRYRDGVFVEWYCDFDHVRPLFERFIPKHSRVLDVGCGDKPLAWGLREAGYTGKITSFDFSPTVIERLLSETRSCERKRLDEGVEFMVLDARDLPFDACSFELVVDKGTVDAMLCDNAGKGSARAICREAARVVAPGGWFVLVSHIHPATPEGIELLSEALEPALQDSSFFSNAKGKGKKEAGGGEAEKAFTWSLDVHCGGGEGGEESRSESDDGGGGGREEEEASSRADDDEGASRQVGPSVYMARKMVRRHTRSSAAPVQRAIAIRIHEY